MSLFANKHIIPVLMFHSVGLENHNWVFSHISEPLDLFRKKLKYFSHRNFNTIFWDDLYYHMKNEKILPKNSLMLTFDDGYLDNWVYVYPYLQKYGIKATIFVNPDFVDPSPSLRPNLQDVWAGRCGSQELQPAGFLSWSEMREMEKSGLIDIQSHALTHTWYFSGDRIIDFHKPQKISPYPWLFWNKRPDRKPFYLVEDQQLFIPYGHPVFEYEKSLVARRFFPDERYVTQIVDYALSKGKDFYQKPGWKDELKNFSKNLTNNSKPDGRYESYQEKCERIKKELIDSMTLIGKKLDKQVDFICWPGGGYDETVTTIARQVGYKAWTISSRELFSFRNFPGSNPENIKRISSSNRISIKGYGNSLGGNFYQLLKIRSHQNSLISKQFLRTFKLISVLKESIMK